MVGRVLKKCGNIPTNDKLNFWKHNYLSISKKSLFEAIFRFSPYIHVLKFFFITNQNISEMYNIASL